MTNPWVEHCKKYAKDHNISYKEALKQAKSSYTKTTKPTKKQTKQTKNIKGGFLKKRQPGLFPPKSRRLIAEVGDEKVVSLRLERKPILGWLNVITFGAYKRALKRVGYDRMYHLSIIINDKYRLEKREVLNFEIYKETKVKNTEYLDVPIPPEYDATINDLINITRDFMTPERFSDYDVQDENCQIFIKSVLEANGLLTPDLEQFIQQDVESILKQFSGSRKVITGITDLAAKINRLIEGEGKKKKKKPKIQGRGNDYPTEPKGLIFQLSSTEMSRLQDVYYSRGNYNGYDVVQVQMYYPDNFAIGGIGKLGWKQFPKSKALGYHKHDVEAVAIYYKNNIPEKVVMSCHGLQESNIYDYNDCVFQDGFLVVYVARNSHGNYHRPGLKKRVKGLANDVASTDGETIRVPWAEMKPARDIDYPGCCRVYSGIRPQPTEPTLTHDERWLIDRKNGYI